MRHNAPIPIVKLVINEREANIDINLIFRLRKFDVPVKNNKDISRLHGASINICYRPQTKFGAR